MIVCHFSRTRMAQLQQTTLARRERDKEKSSPLIQSTGRATEREFLEKAMLTAPAHLLSPIPPLPKKTEKEVGKEWGVDEITHYA